MLGLDIARILRPMGFKSAAVYLRERGFTVKETRTLSHPHKRQILRDTTVKRLCEALLCTPNDLFRWQGPQESHLNVLNIAPASSIDSVFGHLNQRELDQLVSKVQELAISTEPALTDGEGHLWLHVPHIIAQRQQSQPYPFLKTKGFTHSESATLLDPTRKAFKLTVLSRLCLAFDCLPNDLFDWEGSEEHYLNALRKRPAPDLKTLLSKLPPEKVQELLRQLR
jgi:DNA-binding Xre family transcriptional regulator